MESPKTDIASMDLPALEIWFAQMGEKKFRAKQVFQWIHQRGAQRFEEMTNLSKALRECLAEKARLSEVTIAQCQTSSDGTRKYRLTTRDGHSIESVFIPNASGEGINALCISSQVGCAMGCTFCATAAMKLVRNLSGGEIIGQYHAVVRHLIDDGIFGSVKVSGEAQRPIQNIVYMGMGEPLHNYDAVLQSIRLLRAEAGANFSNRRITVSTSGLIPQIKKLGEDSDVNLAISVNGSEDISRSEVMPVNKKWNLEALMQACREFPLPKRRRITLEYVMLAGVNDSDDDARRLIRLSAGVPAKINLIPFNDHPLSDFERPKDERVKSFQTILVNAGRSVFVRRTRGDDIDAACGMLGAEKLERERRKDSGQGLVQIG